MPETPSSTQNHPGRLQADLALLSVAIIWGSAFVAQRIAAPNSSAFIFNGLRFLLAALVLSPFVLSQVRRRKNPVPLNRSGWTSIVIAGLLLASGAVLQQAGLRYTTAGNAGFITGLYVVIIPIIQAVVMKQRVRPVIWAAVLLAAIGLFLLSTGGKLSLKIGDALELAGAFFWALHVIWIGMQARRIDGLQLAAGQYLVCGLASLGLGLIIEPGQILAMPASTWAIVYTGVISVGVGYTLQIYGQKAAPPADAAILLSLEAVFAAIFGWFFLNEMLTTTQLLGCMVMLAGMLLAQASSLRQRVLGFFVIAWLIPSLACNFPGKVPQVNNPTEKELRQTLAAQFSSTPATLTDFTPSAPAPAIQVTAAPGILPTPGIPPTEQSQSAHPAVQNANYFAQSGDTLTAVARRFQVEPGQIQSSEVLPESGFLTPGQPLFVPVDSNQVPTWGALLPDSEIINSPTALDFNLREYINSAGGFLNMYTEDVYNQRLSGAEIIERVSQESSVNPRFLLAFLEFRSGWVLGQPRSRSDLDHPIGFYVPNQSGLYNELVMAATHLNIGYYGWRLGQQTYLKFSDGSTASINPWLNPGTVAVQNLFAKFYSPQPWADALYSEQNFSDLYQQAFGDPWRRAAQVEPFFGPGMTQPALELPFAAGERWSLTGGPHPSWNPGSPRGALDFAPVTGEASCSVSRAWVTASSDGIVVRSANSVVAIDVDGDGREETGWVVVYLHIAEADRIPVGQRVQVETRLGHPSCERGQSTGTHVHIARKFNGEWLEADGPIPFILSGWQVKAGEKNYLGSLVKGSQEVTASPVGPRTSIIVR